MINIGAGGGRDNPTRTRLTSEERLWRENFEARVWNTINEMKHQIENNRKEVTEQWEIMQEIKIQHNEIMVMIENLQVAMYSSQVPTEAASGFDTKTRKKRTPDNSKKPAVVINEPDRGEAQFDNPTAMTTLRVKRSKPYSFRKDKTTQIFEQAMKNGLPLPACKRPEDIRRAEEGDFCPYHRILGHTIEECWVFKDLIERGCQGGII
jgi:hypothetical protein